MDFIRIQRVVTRFTFYSRRVEDGRPNDYMLNYVLNYEVKAKSAFVYFCGIASQNGDFCQRPGVLHLPVRPSPDMIKTRTSCCNQIS
jgi:hypothetical protein